MEKEEKVNMSERKLILKMLQENRISIEEADALLSAMEPKGTAGPAGGEAPPEHPPASSQSNPASQIFEKAGPKVEQMMGGLSSLINSVSQTVSQQLGPNLEQRFEGWFKQAKGEKPDDAFEDVRQQEVTLPVEGGTQLLRCFHKLGELTVEGYDGREVQAVLEKRINTSRVEDKLRYEDLRLISRQDGSTLHLELAGSDAVKRSECTVNLKLRVPTQLDLDLRTESGDILLSQVSRTAGKARMESESGNLELRSIALKHLELQTRSGRVTADQASELIQIQTQSGDVKLKGSVYEGQLSTASGQLQIEASVAQLLNAKAQSGDLSLQLLEGRGKLELSTASGDIDLTGTLRGDSSLQTASGDLHCDLSLEGANISFTTTSGDVDLILRPGSAGKLEANTTSGDIECRLGLQSKEQSEHGLRGVLGEGGGTLKIQTVSGDVLIS